MSTAPTIQADLDPPPMLAHYAGAVLVVATLIACAGLLVLWLRSFRTFDEVIVPGSGSELRLASNDGAVVIGVFRDRGAELRTRGLWRRPRRTEYARLLDETVDNPLPFGVAPGPYEVGVVVPHWALAVPLGVASAWWLLGEHRHRPLRRHRRAHGLCGQCGYDLRQSPERCPECGARRDAFHAPAAATGGVT